MLLDAVLLTRLQFFWVNWVFRGNVRTSEEYEFILQRGERARVSVPPSEVSS